VPTNFLAPDNARLRQSVTGEHFTAADRHARACWPSGSSVLPDASPDQRWLETQFLWALYSLKYVGVDLNREAGYELFRVEPHADHLFVKFHRGWDLSDVAARILPSADERDGYVGGIPGLRFRPHRRGTSLHIPGLDALIVLDKVSEKVWQSAISNAVSDVDTRLLLWSQSPDRVTDAEADRLNEMPSPEALDDSASILLRRIRTLETLKPLMVSVWPARRHALHVEVWVLGHDTELADGLIATMTDSRLTPRLQFVKRDGTWLEFESPSRGRIVVRVELHPLSPAAAALRAKQVPGE
jgi:hypothetical protein